VTDFTGWRTFIAVARNHAVRDTEVLR
jgi:hypothetical protein